MIRMVIEVNMSKPSVYQALSVLSSPWSLAAMGLLLLNDFWLRRFWPDWWTGKLSDFAWVFLTPFLAELLLALALPRRWRTLERRIGFLVFCLPAAGFALLKTVPGVQGAILSLGASLGIPLASRIDPTDLIALLALAPAWRLWRSGDGVPQENGSGGLRKEPGASQPSLNGPLRPGLRSPGWLVLPLAALVLLADAAAPDYGINCLIIRPDGLVATSFYSGFVSQDGGATWTSRDSHSDCRNLPSEGIVINPANPEVQYRYSVGNLIEISTDGGSHWGSGYQLKPISQAGAAYYAKTSGSSNIVSPGPLAALVDPASGNAIFAMGHEGVLVHRPDGQWTWVGLGKYRRTSLWQPGAMYTLLGGELNLAVELGLFFLAIWTLPQRRGKLRRVLLGLGLAAWGLGAGVLPPALANSYAAFPSSALQVCAAIVALPMGVEAVVSLWQPLRRTALQAVGLAALAAGAFMLPFGLWAVSILPTYYLALFFSVLLSGVILWRARSFLLKSSLPRENQPAADAAKLS